MAGRSTGTGTGIAAPPVTRAGGTGGAGRTVEGNGRRTPRGATLGPSSPPTTSAVVTPTTGAATGTTGTTTARRPTPGSPITSPTPGASAGVSGGRPTLTPVASSGASGTGLAAPTAPDVRVAGRAPGLRGASRSRKEVYGTTTTSNRKRGQYITRRVRDINDGQGKIPCPYARYESGASGPTVARAGRAGNVTTGPAGPVFGPTPRTTAPSPTAVTAGSVGPLGGRGTISSPTA